MREIELLEETKLLALVFEALRQNTPEAVTEAIKEVFENINAVLVILRNQTEPTKLTKKWRDLHKQAVGTHWVNDGIVQELANAVPELCRVIENKTSRIKEFEEQTNFDDMKLNEALEKRYNEMLLERDVALRKNDLLQIENKQQSKEIKKLNFKKK